MEIRTQTLVARIAVSLSLAALPASAQVQRDVTFIFAADPQYLCSFLVCNTANESVVVNEMNKFQNGDMPGPTSMSWGDTPRPRGVLIGGDLINSASSPLASIQEEGNFSSAYCWRVNDFLTWPTGVNPLKQLAYPALEGLGNHDQNNGGSDGSGLDSGIANLLLHRNLTRDTDVFNEGGAPNSALVNYSYSPEGNYAWTWDDVRFVQLNEYAAGARHDQGVDTIRGRYARNSLKFLACDLATYASNGEPVVIVQHYPIRLEYTQEEQADLWSVIKNYNVFAFFTGHAHLYDCMYWHDGNYFDTCSKNDGEGPYDVTFGGAGGGGLASSPFGFLVVRMLDDKVRIARWSSPNVGGAPSTFGWSLPQEYDYPTFAPLVPDCGDDGGFCGCDDFGSYCGPLGYSNGGGYQGVVDEIAAAQCGYGTPLIDVETGTYASPAGAVTLSGPAVLRTINGSVIID